MTRPSQDKAGQDNPKARQHKEHNNTGEEEKKKKKKKKHRYKTKQRGEARRAIYIYIDYPQLSTLKPNTKPNSKAKP